MITARKKSCNILLVSILIINSLFMFTYICKMVADRDDEIQLENLDLDKLSLDIDIMDIYRLDISCDYVTKALGSKLSTKYKNKNKKCSLASLDLKVNNLLLESINASLTSSKAYFPTYNVTDTVDFVPFNDTLTRDQLKKYPQFVSLKPGNFLLNTMQFFKL